MAAWALAILDVSSVAESSRKNAAPAPRVAPDDVAPTWRHPLKRRVAAMERMLEVAIQAAADVAAHLVADHGWATPETAGQSFAELARQGLIDGGLAQRLRRAVGLRNMLAWDDPDIDPTRLFAGLGADLSDLRTFVAAVLASRSRAG